MLFPGFAIFTFASALLPWGISYMLTRHKATVQQFQLIKSFSLLVLGMSLATLATLNFSLAFIVGILATPFTFVQTSKNTFVRYSLASVLTCIAPPIVVYSSAQTFNVSIAEVLREASFGWNVWGMYTPIVVWCVWWPAWVLGMVNVVGSPAV